MIPLQVRTTKGVSLANQLIWQLKRGIMAGKIGDGERLPSVRELSVQVGLHPLTIAKAYASLEHEGLVVTRWGKGTFVHFPKASGARASRQYVRGLVAKFIEETLPLVSDKRELKTLLDEQLQAKR